jgi:hypothetical protein
MRERAITASTLVAVVLALGGCAVHYDRSGESRVGVFLWGLGDPPGVHWNLETPRREIQDLPASPRRDALPPNQNSPQRSTTTMNDNFDCATSRAPEPNAAGIDRRADDRDDDTARR